MKTIFLNKYILISHIILIVWLKVTKFSYNYQHTTSLLLTRQLLTLLYYISNISHLECASINVRFDTRLATYFLHLA